MVTVNNTPPKVNVVSAANATAGEYTLTADVFDQGTLDTFTFAWTVTGATIVGAANQQSLRVASATGTFTVSVTVTDDDTGSTTFTVQVRIGTAGDDSITLTNPAATIHKIIVFALAGNDTVNAGGVTTVPVELIGGFGNDGLTGGAKDDLLLGNSPGDYALGAAGDTGNDTLTGNAGNDTLDGGLGNDTMTGGTGNDRYIEVPGSDDVLIEGGAGAGIDTIDYHQAFFGIRFDLATTNTAQVVNPAAPLASQHTVEIRGDFENLLGSRFTDDLTGNSLKNDLRGGRGNDAIRGGAGNDVIFGGDNEEPLPDDGDDSLSGGTGDDSLTGGTGDDTLLGGLDDDVLTGDDGDDVIFGGDDEEPLPDDGDDSLAGGDGDDSLFGGLGDDVLTGDDGDDVIFGGDNEEPLPDDGDDSLAGGTGDDSLTGGTGDDTLLGGLDDDVLTGDDGDDVIFGGDDEEPLPNDGDDSLAGGGGDDSLFGGLGDDVLSGDDGDDVIFGGDNEEPLPDDGDDSLSGGTGDDSLTGGTGDDTLLGGLDDDVLTGDDGDDVIFGGDDEEPLPDDGDDSLAGGAGDDSLFGGLGDDVLTGDDGDDVIFGGDDEEPLPDDGDDSLSGGMGDDSLAGGTGDDTLLGGLDDDVLTGDDGDDVIFGGPGDDALSGGEGLDVFEGGSGQDRIVETRNANITLSPTQLAISGAPIENHFDIEAAILWGGPGNNIIDASAFLGAVILFGFGGNDTLIGGPLGDALLGGAGNDILIGNGGDDTLEGGAGDDTMDGGTGNDRYLQTPGSTDVLNDSQGIDSIDLGAATQAVNVDLSRTGPQTIDSAGNVLTLNGTFENFRGTSFNDVIRGNAERNLLDGAGGTDLLDGGFEADTIQGSVTQLVYLDFVTATGPGEKVYSVEERNAIQSRLEQIYPAPFSISFTQTRPPIGRFTTIVVNAGNREENEPLVGGAAGELDWRNYNPGSVAAVNVNDFLGRRGQPAASYANFVALTTTVIAHELGHLFGLQHVDSFGPIGTGVFAPFIARSRSRDEVAAGTAIGVSRPNTATYELHRAVHRGPVLLEPTIQAGNTAANPFQPPQGTIFNATTAVASFTVDSSGLVHATPLPNQPQAVTGGRLDPISGRLELDWLQLPAQSAIKITYYYDALRPGYRGPDDAFETPGHVMASPASVGTRIEDALRATHLSQRSLIKLAFADAGIARQEADLAMAAAPAALGGAGRDLGNLSPLAVPNTLPAGTINAGTELGVRAANVVASIQRTAGGAGPSEQDVYAFTGRAGELVTIEVLSVLLAQRFANVIDATVSLHGPDGSLVNYYGRPAFNDDGFESQDPLLLDVLLPADGTYYIVVGTFFSTSVPQDTGGYELFIYSYRPSPGQRLGGAGDMLIGGDGADVLIGSSGDDRFVGDPAVDQFLRASAFDFVGPANQPPSIAVDNTTVSIGEGATAANMGTFGDPDPGAIALSASIGTVVANANGTWSWSFAASDGPDQSQLVTITATDSDGASSATTFQLFVTNVAPSVAANNATVTVDEGSTAGNAGTFDDLGNDLVSLSASIGTIVANPNGTWSWSFAASDGPDQSQVVTITATDSDGASSTTTFQLTVNNVAPSVAANNATVTVDEGTTAGNTGTFADLGNDFVSLSASIGTVVANVNGTWSWSFATSDGPDQSQVVTITATDSDGASSTTTFQLTVNNVAPSVAANNTIVTVDEGTAAANSGNFADLGNDFVTLSASIGTVVANANGTWGWSFATSDGPDQSQFVTITATDSDGASSTTTFQLTVNNVAPSIVANNTIVTVDEGTTAGNAGTFADLGNDGVSLSASNGTVVANANGTWSWSFATSDGPDQSQVVTITATDSDGASSTTNFQLIVNNVAPSVAANNATVSVDEGATAGNTGTFDDLGNDFVTLSASIGTVVANANGTWSWSFATSDGPDQSQFATITATDSDGASSTTTFQLTVNNVAPSIVANNTIVTVDEGTTAGNAGTFADLGNDVVSLSASNGTVVANANGTWSWSFATSDGPDQSQFATITATDSDGASSTTTFQLTVNNVAPSVAANSTFVTVDERATAGNTGTFDDPGNDFVSLSASIGTVVANPDGTWSWSFAANDGPDQSQVVTMTATDSDGASSTTIFQLTVNNVAPSVAANSATVTVDEGTIAGNTGTFDDLGNDVVILSASIGTVVANPDGTWSWSFAASDGPDQSQLVTITATDSDGASSSTTFQLTVNNVAPSVAADSATVTVDEGTTAGNAGTFDDLGNDVVSLSASIGTVVANANGTWSWSFAASDGPDQSQLVTITATDSDGASSTTTFQLIVNNVAPSVAITGAAELAVTGAAIHLAAAVSDPGSGDTHTVLWSVTHDGSPFATGSDFNFSFVPNGHGTYLVSVIATDDDGAAASNERRIVVHTPGAGNVAVAFKNGKTTIDGDQQNNALVMTAGSLGASSLRIVGLNGTRINGQTGPVEIASPGAVIEIDLKGGNDWLYFDGRGSPLNVVSAIDIRTQQGEDHVRFEHVLVQGSATVDTGVQANDVRLSDATFLGVLLIDARSGADRIRTERVSAAGKATFDGGVGRNEIRLADSTFAQQLLVRAQSGDDLIRLERLQATGPATIDAGVGDNEVFIIDSGFGSTLTLDAGSGDDLMRIERTGVAGDARIDAGVGANVVELMDAVFSSGLSIDSGSGADLLRLLRTRVGGDTTIDAGVGHNQIHLLDAVFSGSLTIDTGSGADLVNIERSRFAGRVAMKTGAGSDRFAIRDSIFEDAVLLDGESGDDEIDAGLLGNPNANGNLFALGILLEDIEDILT